MTDIFTYKMPTNMIMHGNSGKKEDTIETVSDKHEKGTQSGNKPEKQEISESRAEQMHQIWGDKFVSDSLH